MKKSFLTMLLGIIMSSTVFAQPYVNLHANGLILTPGNPITLTAEPSPGDFDDNLTYGYQYNLLSLPGLWVAIPNTNSKTLVVTNFYPNSQNYRVWVIEKSPGKNAVQDKKYFSNFICICKDCGVLPIVIKSFSAIKTSESTIRINWETASETGTTSFEIQRSIDNGEKFTTVGTIKAAGNSTDIRRYQMEDRLDTASLNVYYHIKTKDIDGSTSYSKVVRVKMKNSSLTGVREFKIGPNPAKDFIQIVPEGIINPQATISILGTDGRRVLQQSYGTGKVILTQLQKGTYFVTVTHERTGEMTTQKLIIIK